MSEGWEGSRRRAVDEGEVGRECGNDGGSEGGGRARAASSSRGEEEEEGASSFVACGGKVGEWVRAMRG